MYSDEAGRKAHRGLFALPEGSYHQAGADIPADILKAVGGGAGRLHLVLSWEALLSVAVWSHGRPAMFDVLSLLRRSGLTDADLAPFAGSDPGDLFPWLYYGKRLDVLRKVCSAAKAKVESHAGPKRLLVSCHLSCSEMHGIVASSL
ncbi:MAG: hypothetical protein OHK006_07850 [Thermodesulfovibrionales bacterium]